MKKLFLSIVTLMLLLSVVMPVAVQAATISIDKTQMKVGDIVEVKVNIKKDVENIQFDMKFDNTKYEYVNDSATSKLDSTGSNLISENVVRVSAFNLNKTKADTVSLKFKATNTGEGVPFSIVGTVEIGEAGEKFDNVEIKVEKINAVSKVTVDQYYDEFGNPIPRHPQTGEEIAQKDKTSVGTYEKLIENKIVVPYALQNSDNTISVDNVKTEFGAITTTASNPVKTGDTFMLDGKEHTVVVYGDVNKDGRVTTLDALKIRKNQLDSNKVKFDAVQLEAADVENNAIITEKDALAVQQFILGLRVTKTDTIIDRYPDVEIPEKVVEGITKLSGESAGTHYIYAQDTVIATIASNNDVKLTADMLDFIVEEAPKGANTANAIKYIDKGNGIFEVRLYATEPGDHKIVTVVNGANVKNGVIEVAYEPITVKEYYTVEDIKILDAQDNDVTNNLVSREGKESKRKVRFYHNYTDINGKKVARNITEHVAVEKTTFVANTPNMEDGFPNLYNNKLDVNGKAFAVLYDENGNYKSGNGPIDHIIIKGKQAGTGDTITIGVNNEDGTIQYTKTINITVSTQAKIKSIILDGKELTNGQETSMNLYTTNPNLDIVDVDTANSRYYTIATLKLRDEDNDVISITAGNIGKITMNVKDGQIAVLENATSGNTNNMSSDIQLRKYYLDENDNYVSTSTSTVSLDAIGIALSKPTEADSVAKIGDYGLTINFDGITGRETIQVNTIIDPAGIATTSEEEEKEDNTIKENGNTNVINDVLSTPNKVKAPSKTNEVSNNTVTSNEIVNTVTSNTVEDTTDRNTVVNEVSKDEKVDTKEDTKISDDIPEVSSDKKTSNLPDAGNE